MRLVAKMKWVEKYNEWHLQTANDKRLGELPDCENIDQAFDNELDKNKETPFVIDIRRLTNG